MDFSAYPPSGRYYGGTERKIGILIEGTPYMIKFQKASAFGLRNNHLSEHIGSLLFNMLGLPAQETLLGTYNGQPVVACRDFIGGNEQFVPFNDVGESSLDRDKETYQYDYEDIMQMLRDNSKLTCVQETMSAFWEMYIIDALVGNFDRHGANWGFIKKNNAYRLAPIFDNGSCLFPSLPEDQMSSIIRSPEQTDARVYEFPTSQIRLNGKKSSYFEVINSLAFPECNKALAAVISRSSLSDILATVEDIAELSDAQKRFYRHMLLNRYEKILAAPYERLMGGRQ